jgi:hypothetical protein
MTLMVFRLYLMAMLKIEAVADGGGDTVDDLDVVLLVMSMLVAMLMARNSDDNHNSDNDQWYQRPIDQQRS